MMRGLSTSTITAGGRDTQAGEDFSRRREGRKERLGWLATGLGLGFLGFVGFGGKKCKVMEIQNFLSSNSILAVHTQRAAAGAPG